MRINNRAQSILTIAAIIAIVALVMIAMKKYSTGAVQGKIRDSADVFGGGAQYQPGATQKNY